MVTSNFYNKRLFKVFFGELGRDISRISCVRRAVCSLPSPPYYVIYLIVIPIKKQDFNILKFPCFIPEYLLQGPEFGKEFVILN